MKICTKCGQHIADSDSYCSVCGTPVNQTNSNNSEYVNAEYTSCNRDANTPPYGYSPKSRLLAGLLGILLGGYGVHNFYLGFTTKAVIQIIVTCITCGIGGLWGFIEGILILCRQINTDAYGVPLKQDC